MNANEVINMVLDSLPESLLNEALFNKLRSEYFSDLDGAFLVGNISIDEPLYDELIGKNILLEDYLNVDKIGRVLRLSFYKNTMHILEVDGCCGHFNVELMYCGANIKKRINISIEPTERLVTYVTEKENQGVIDDYYCEIGYYDEEGNLIPKDTQDLIDLEFRSRFLVPKEKARFLRTNFKDFKDSINSSYIKQKTESEEQYLDSSDFSFFEGPFRIDNFTSNFIYYMQYKLYKLFKELDIEEPEDTFNEKFLRTDLLDKLGINLRQQMVCGEIIMSNNMYEVLYEVLDGFSGDTIHTRGLIIRKLDGVFTLYYAQLDNNEIVLMPQELTTHEAQELFYKNENNQNNSELKSFFGINRGR